MSQKNKIIVFALCGIALLVLPLVLQQFGNAWVRIVDIALLYVMLALGLNIVVGEAGLLDLGYVAFFAVGAYLYGLLASPHLTSTFAAIGAAFPNGFHTSLWLVIPVALLLATFTGVLLGIPVLKLRGDYLAIVTLGFGEIIRIFLNNLDHPYNITNGPKGINQIDSVKIFGLDLGRPLTIGGFEIASVSLYYYLFLVLVLAAGWGVPSGVVSSSKVGSGVAVDMSTSITAGKAPVGVVSMARCSEIMRVMPQPKKPRIPRTSRLPKKRSRVK